MSGLKRETPRRIWRDFICISCSFLLFSPLTKVKLINKLNEREADLGVSESVSWHTEYKDSAWIFIGKLGIGTGPGPHTHEWMERLIPFRTQTFSLLTLEKYFSLVDLCSTFSSSLTLCPAGGFPYELTEGDIICVFSQYVSSRHFLPAPPLRLEL